MECIDGKVGTLIGTSISQFLTKNETTIPTSFTTLGTTSAESVINCNSNSYLQSNNIASYFQIKNNSNPSAAQIGVYDLDLFLKYPSNTSSLLVQNLSANTLFTINSGGSCYNLTGTYGTISSKKVKTNIRPSKNYLADFRKLNFVKYQLIDDVNNGIDRDLFGLIAEEVQGVYPRLVEEIGGLKSIKSSILNMIGLKVIQELINEIDELKNKILEAELNICCWKRLNETPIKK